MVKSEHRNDLTRDRNDAKLIENARYLFDTYKSQKTELHWYKNTLSVFNWNYTKTRETEFYSTVYCSYQGLEPEPKQPIPVEKFRSGTLFPSQFMNS